jgi:hypothetical protein
VRLLWDLLSFSIFFFGVPIPAIKRPLSQESIRIAVFPLDGSGELSHFCHTCVFVAGIHLKNPKMGSR